MSVKENLDGRVKSKIRKNGNKIFILYHSELFDYRVQNLKTIRTTELLMNNENVRTS